MVWWQRGAWSVFGPWSAAVTMEANLEDEIRLHIELETEANLRAGNGARLRHGARPCDGFGGVEKVKEGRDGTKGGCDPLEDLVSDIRFAGRSLRKARGFTAAVDPHPRPRDRRQHGHLQRAEWRGSPAARLPGTRTAWCKCARSTSPSAGFCTNSFVNVRDFDAGAAKAFERLGAGRGWPFILRGTGRSSESIRGGLADDRVVPRVPECLRRWEGVFVETDLGPDAAPVVLLSHSTWRIRLRSRP